MTGQGKLGICAHLANDPALWAKIASLGVTYARIDGNWDSVQPERAVWEWSVLDRAIDGCRAVGLTPYVTLAYTPGWANGGAGRQVPAAEVMDWRSYVRAFGERYADRVTYVGIGNEPNTNGWSVEGYIRQLWTPAVEELRAVTEGFQVCGPELATMGDWQTWLHQLLQDAGKCLNVLTVHSYAATGREVLDRLGRDRFAPWERLSVRQVMALAGYLPLPLALTETGWNTATVSEERQAKNYDELFEAMESCPWLVAALGFNAINEPPGPDGVAHVQWGVFRDDVSEKPAAAVFRKYTGGGVRRA